MRAHAPPTHWRNRRGPAYARRRSGEAAAPAPARQRLARGEDELSIHVQVSYPNGQGLGVQLDHYPDMCPICHTAVNPTFVAAMAVSDHPASRMDAAFRCTRIQCRRMFVAAYESPNPASLQFTLLGTAPKTPKPAAFGDEISKTSPTFVQVYNQSLAAEDAGLDQMVGMGLRKALEFLVKDFAISQTAAPDEQDAIKRTLLGPCIEKYIADAQVRSVAKRAVWLGNDETHYVRKWETKDIKDRKQLVRLTVNAVENALLAKHYEKEMPGG